MEILQILMGQIGLFVIYIIIGMILIKTKVLNQDMLETISRLVLKLAMPLMIFTNTVNGVDRRSLVQSLVILVLTALFYLGAFLLAKLMAMAFRLQGDYAQVYRALSMFGNVGFMGIPIVSNVFPDKGMLYIAVFTIIDQTVLWTLGVKLTSPGGKGKFDPRKMINPCTVAVVLSVLLVIIGLPLPSLLNAALQKIGATATPLAMIYLGAVFACMDVRRYLRIKEFYGIVIIKMVLFPILLYLVTGLFPVEENIRLTLALLAGMPAMASTVMMARASGSKWDYAMGGICVTTICSIVTIPAMFWFIQMVL